MVGSQLHQSLCLLTRYDYSVTQAREVNIKNIAEDEEALFEHDLDQGPTKINPVHVKLAEKDISDDTQEHDIGDLSSERDIEVPRTLQYQSPLSRYLSRNF